MADVETQREYTDVLRLAQGSNAKLHKAVGEGPSGIRYTVHSYA
jgi:hypothetical protein